PACPFFGCPAAAPGRETQKQRAWELGLRWTVVPEVALYARANRSFRFANVDEIYDAFPVAFKFLRPQHAQTREVGADWCSRYHGLRVALFQTDVKNEIHFNPLTFDNTNLAPTRREGAELEA